MEIQSGKRLKLEMRRRQLSSCKMSYFASEGWDEKLGVTDGSGSLREKEERSYHTRVAISSVFLACAWMEGGRRVLNPTLLCVFKWSLFNFLFPSCEELGFGGLGRPGEAIIGLFCLSKCFLSTTPSEIIFFNNLFSLLTVASQCDDHQTQ